MCITHSLSYELYTQFQGRTKQPIKYCFGFPCKGKYMLPWATNGEIPVHKIFVISLHQIGINSHFPVIPINPIFPIYFIYLKKFRLSCIEEDFTELLA